MTEYLEGLAWTGIKIYSLSQMKKLGTSFALSCANFYAFSDITSAVKYFFQFLQSFIFPEYFKNFIVLLLMFLKNHVPVAHLFQHIF